MRPSPLCAACLVVVLGGSALAAPLAQAAPALDEPPLTSVPARHASSRPRPAHRDKAPPATWVFDDPGQGRRPQQLSLMLGASFDQLTAGLWYAFPFLGHGPIEEVNNALYAELGLFGRSSFFTDSWLTASGGVRWNFYLTTLWTAFAALRLNVNFGVAPGGRGFYLLPDVSIGGLYRLSRAARLRLELGFPTGIGIGLALQF